ncbi:MAG: lipid-A-disaccharide synthase [Bacteroidota bacterium]
MKYFILAGEASGDMHGSNLIRSIAAKDTHATVYCWGGDAMQKTGAQFLKHYSEYSVMGFVEVLLKLNKIKQALDECKETLLRLKPDVVVLIDFPGFNLRIAEFCHSHNIKVVYYISPKVWAWKQSRVKKMEKYVNLLLLIFPFERDFFSKYAVPHRYVGNPLLDALHTFEKNTHFYTDNKLDHRPIIALMPGSRMQEIKRMMPVMQEITHFFPEYEFVIAGAPAIPDKVYTPYLSANCRMVSGQTYQLLAHAHAAIVCSGTATLETALFNVPQVCGYKANALSYYIAKMLVNIKFISLVNLCMNRKVITELIQYDWSVSRVYDELKKILESDSAERKQMLSDYTELRTLLGENGASDRSSDAIMQFLSADTH